jgi:predicted CopG family antitoxin
MQNTTIAINPQVKAEIEQFGIKGESYSEIIARLLKSAHERLLHDVLMDETSCLTIKEARAELNKKWPRSK